MPSSPSDYDPLSPEAVADPYPIYARLRSSCPVLWHERLDSWVLTRYKDCIAVLRDPVPAYPVVMLVGATYFGMVTALNTAFQSRLHDHERGRAMALWMMGFGGTVSLANIAFGPLVDEIGITTPLLVGAGISLLLAWYADLRAPGTERAAEGLDVAVSPGD